MDFIFLFLFYSPTAKLAMGSLAQPRIALVRSGAAATPGSGGFRSFPVQIGDEAEDSGADG